jgi:hypothetical protein
VKRLSDFLPASELILRGAPPWQVAHGLLSLAEGLAIRRKITIEMALGDSSPLHSWVHLFDLKLSKPKMWEGIILAQVQEMEGRIG